MSKVKTRTDINQYYGIGTLGETDMSKLILGSSLKTMYAKTYEIAKALLAHNIPTREFGIYTINPDYSLTLVKSMHYNGGMLTLMTYDVNPSGEVQYVGQLQGSSLHTVKQSHPSTHFSDSEVVAEQMRKTIEQRRNMRIKLDKSIPLNYTLEVHTLKGIENGYTLASTVLPLPVANYLSSFVITGNIPYVADSLTWLNETLETNKRRGTLYIPYAYAKASDARNRTIYAMGLVWGYHMMRDLYSYGDIISEMEKQIGSLTRHGYTELYNLANSLGIGNLSEGYTTGLNPSNFQSLFAFLFLLYVLYESKELKTTSMALERVYTKFSWVFNILNNPEQFA